MTSMGRFTKDKFGFDMPGDAPLYNKPPIYYKNAEVFGVTYETDEDAVLDLLPEGLEISSPATATLLFFTYPFSTLGPYEETILALPCLWQGEPRSYVAHIVVNTVAPLAAGREIWGYPKKLADITFERDEDVIIGTMERPAGNRIVTAGIMIQEPMEEEQTGRGGVSLRIIPSPEKGAEPSVAELIEVPPKSTTLEMWTGKGWVQYESTSMIDPWHKIPVKNVLGAFYRVYDSVLDYGKIIKTY